MNEQLQQAIVELINVIKGGSNQLPAFLTQLTTELAQYQYMSGLVWTILCLLSIVPLGFLSFRFMRMELKGKDSDGVVGAFSIITGALLTLALLFMCISIGDVLQAKYAPSSVLIEFIAETTKGCEK